MSIDSTQANERMAAMWLGLAEGLEAAAYAALEAQEANLAIRYARLADCCFWQATGESEVGTLDSLTEARGEQS